MGAGDGGGVGLGDGLGDGVGPGEGLGPGFGVGLGVVSPEPGFFAEATFAAASLSDPSNPFRASMPDRLLKIPGVFSTSSALFKPTGSGSAGGAWMAKFEAGSVVGVTTVGAPNPCGVTPVIAGASSGHGEVCQSQNRVLSITSDALQ